ncbi:hypothetical protein D8674_026538 [Pyrus ussuriensis x Pyrus communis]|uniref:Uncharacterized protein n=1 Tax=Pyrus ussuriensis x Pyrus communis TaxID=2448454 RepID=A0A5N5ILQ9_9ROSA|nr:hypothetical protein D8674_026538 [Pyrus ussuriensis x Pyrus communis]
MSSPIPMAKHIWFIYSDDEDDAINGPEEEEVHEVEEKPEEEEDPEEDPSEEFATIGSPLHSTGSSQSEEF